MKMTDQDLLCCNMQYGLLFYDRAPINLAVFECQSAIIGLVPEIIFTFFCIVWEFIRGHFIDTILTIRYEMCEQIV